MLQQTKSRSRQHLHYIHGLNADGLVLKACQKVVFILKKSVLQAEIKVSAFRVCVE